MEGEEGNLFQGYKSLKELPALFFADTENCPLPLSGTRAANFGQ